MKQSGLGRESGMEAINDYLETKSVMISTASSAPENAFVQR
jgi:aldehyde dehydrogenase (NAD+)